MSLIWVGDRRRWLAHGQVSGAPDVERSDPFSWDLVTPDQLGSLLSGTSVPDLWFLDDLSRAGKVIARSGNGDLFAVGRSRN